MMTVIREITGFHAHLWTSPGWMVIYLAAAAYIWSRGRRKGSSGAVGRGAGCDSGRRLVIFALLTGLVAYCPITAYFLIPDFTPSTDEYTRLGWLLLPIPVVAYAVSLAAGDVWVRGGKIGGGAGGGVSDDGAMDDAGKVNSVCVRAEFSATTVIIAAIVVILLNGSLGTREEMYRLPDNGYKLPQEVIDIADAIETDAVGAGLLFDTTADEGAARREDGRQPAQVTVAVHGYTDDFKYDRYTDYGRLYYGLRQYTPRCLLRWFVLSEDEIEQTQGALTAAVPSDAQYVVVPSDEELLKGLYARIYETDGFAVYRRKGL